MLIPSFPEELLPVVAELRSRVRRLLGSPLVAFNVYDLSDGLLLWWRDNGEIGIGDASQKQFQPILVTINDKGRASSISEWGSKEEIDAAMQALRSHMILDDLADA